MTDDDKTRPAHYGGDANPFEPIKVIESLGWSEGFCLGNALKYLMRAGKKDGESKLDDLKKARWYLDRCIAWELRGAPLPPPKWDFAPDDHVELGDGSIWFFAEQIGDHVRLRMNGLRRVAHVREVRDVVKAPVRNDEKRKPNPGFHVSLGDVVELYDGRLRTVVKIHNNDEVDLKEAYPQRDPVRVSLRESVRRNVTRDIPYFKEKT